MNAPNDWLDRAIATHLGWLTTEVVAEHTGWADDASRTDPPATSGTVLAFPARPREVQEQP